MHTLEYTAIKGNYGISDIASSVFGHHNKGQNRLCTQEHTYRKDIGDMCNKIPNKTYGAMCFSKQCFCRVQINSRRYMKLGPATATKYVYVSTTL